MKKKLTEEDLKLLYKHRQTSLNLREDIYDDITTKMVSILGQIRSLTKDIAVIAGAIAAFTIPVVNTDMVKTKGFAYIALLLLFVTIFYAVHHLSNVLPSELNGLSKQLKLYNELINEDLERVDRTIRTGEVDNMKVDQNSIKERFDSIKEKETTDRSLDILKYLLLFSLMFNFLSFIDFYSIYELLQEVIKLLPM